MKVLVVGSGGREHALAWKLAPRAEVHAAPGNPGIAALGECHPVRADDAEGLLALAAELRADLVVVGPEAPLVAGVADALRRAGTPVLGPGAAGARIEGSKSFAKEVMAAAGVAAARTLAEPAAPCVVKADGLAAGKGVFVCRTEDEVAAGLAGARALGEAVVVEELLEGEEVSVFALCDGRTAVPLGAARDYKRLGDGDEGPNTGGMGAYSPVAEVDVDALVDAVHRPVVEELARRDVPFVGVLFAGLMLTEEGPRVLEFNCRLGDPETQALLPRLDGDLAELLAAAAAGDATGADARFSGAAAVTVVLAAGDYPHGSDAGTPIGGLDAAEAEGAVVFHAGTALRDGRLVTNGGRILAVTALGADTAEARATAYRAVERIELPGARYRRDIGASAERVRG